MVPSAAKPVRQQSRRLPKPHRAGSQVALRGVRQETEQCVIIDGVKFLTNADIDGQGVPPPGAPNVMMATGGTQLKEISTTMVSTCGSSTSTGTTHGKRASRRRKKITVAPYHYLCGGQLTNCVPQPDTNRRLDAGRQADAAARLPEHRWPRVYRGVDPHFGRCGLSNTPRHGDERTRCSVNTSRVGRIAYALLTSATRARINAAFPRPPWLWRGSRAPGPAGWRSFVSDSVRARQSGHRRAPVPT